MLDLTNTGKRKIIVDTTGLPAQKRAKALAKPEVKLAAWKILIHSHIVVGALFKLNPTNFNIDSWCEVTSLIGTIHKSKMQTRNGTNKTLEKLFVEKQTMKTNGGDEIKMDELMKTFTDICSSYGIKYVRTTEDQRQVASFNSILSLMLAFKRRMSEIRITQTSMVIGTEDNGKTNKVGLFTSWGVDGGEFIHQLEGASWNPQLRSALAQSIGPMTGILQLTMADKPKYTTTNGFRTSATNGVCCLTPIRWQMS